MTSFIDLYAFGLNSCKIHENIQYMSILTVYFYQYTSQNSTRVPQKVKINRYSSECRIFELIDSNSWI